MLGKHQRPGAPLGPLSQVGRSATSHLRRGKERHVEDSGRCFRKGLWQTHCLGSYCLGGPLGRSWLVTNSPPVYLPPSSAPLPSPPQSPSPNHVQLSESLLALSIPLTSLCASRGCLSEVLLPQAETPPSPTLPFRRPACAWHINLFIEHPPDAFDVSGSVVTFATPR